MKKNNNNNTESLRNHRCILRWTTDSKWHRPECLKFPNWKAVMCLSIALPSCVGLRKETPNKCTNGCVKLNYLQETFPLKKGSFIKKCQHQMWSKDSKASRLWFNNYRARWKGKRMWNGETILCAKHYNGQGLCGYFKSLGPFVSMCINENFERKFKNCLDLLNQNKTNVQSVISNVKEKGNNSGF